MQNSKIDISPSAYEIIYVESKDSVVNATLTRNTVIKVKDENLCLVLNENQDRYTATETVSSMEANLILVSPCAPVIAPFPGM